MSKFRQVTPPIMSTVARPGWCAEFQFNAFGGKNGRGFDSAREAWYGQSKRHVGELPPAGVAVPIWFSWEHDPNWHAAVSLADGSLMMSPMSGTAVGRSTYSSLDAFLRAFPAMGFLGWAEWMDDTVVVEPVAEKIGNDMSTLYYRLDGKKATFALAGESPGTSANWLETQDQAFANQLAKTHGDAKLLSAGTWDQWKARYLEPLKIAGTVGGGGSAGSAPSAAEVAKAVNDDAARRLAQ